MLDQGKSKMTRVGIVGFRPAKQLFQEIAGSTEIERNSKGPSKSRGSFSCEIEEKVQLPKGMIMEFHPTKAIRLTQIEVEVAMYIFSSTKPIE